MFSCLIIAVLGALSQCHRRIGVEVTFEVIAAAALLREYASALRMCVVNVTELVILATGGSHPHALGDFDFDVLFTPARTVHMNFHGYPIKLKGCCLGDLAWIG